MNFNPRPSYEGRPTLASSRAISSDFNPRPSYEGRRGAGAPALQQLDFNPRPSYEGRPQAWHLCSAASLISIHAPHTRGDLANELMTAIPFDFNPRPSYEGRLGATDGLPGDMQFQSTPLIRGATYEVRAAYHTDCISIHAPHTRGDRSRAAA